MKLLKITVHLLIATFVFCELFIRPAIGDNIFAPEYLWARKIADKKDPVDIANTHLGIPYREDGALDDKGHFTTFAHPEEILDSPGLNCSGLVVSVCRYLFNKNWTYRSGPARSTRKQWTEFRTGERLGLRLGFDPKSHGRQTSQTIST